MAKTDFKDLKDKIEKLGELLKNAREESNEKGAEITKLKRALALAEEVMKRNLIEPDSLPKLIDALKTISEFKMPDEIKVSNLSDKTEVTNFPKSVAVDNFPDGFEIKNTKDFKVEFPKSYQIKGWRDLISELGLVRGLIKGLGEMKNHLFKAVVSGKVEITNREASDAIPVRLTTADSRNFYNAIMSVIGSGGDDNVITKLTAILAAIQSLSISASTSVGDGTATVTTAGTRVQLSSQACKKVFIQAHESNTGTIVVGGATCVAALSGRRGIALFATQSQEFDVNNLNLLYIDSTANGDKINFYYEN